MKRTFSAIGAIGLGCWGLAAACSSSSVPAGNLSSNEGAFTSGWACACPNGATSCPLPCPDHTTGSCQNGQPFCDVTSGEAGLACACPNGQSSCTITCPDGTQGQCTNGDPVCGGQTDAGACCPSNYELLSCTFPDGTPGHACHNPALGCASSTTCGQGCDPVVTGTCGGGGDAGPGPLQWYATCGYPVCMEPDGGFVDAGAGCPPVGSSCTQAGQSCGTASQANCGVTLVCAAQDPKGGPGGCPISSRQYKDGIVYVNDARLQELHDEALGLRLATYKYKPIVGDPGAPTHLGFIIEDNLQTPAVDQAHNRVDMYGYVSMVVAGMQVQEKEIADLRKELEAARRDAATCRVPKK